MILTDDQGWGDLSLHGNTNLSTPHLDQLAREGAQFDRFFVSPVCSPTRAEMLTGRYHIRSGVIATSAGMERMDADETTIAEVLKEAGYATGAFGKWHNGMQAPYHPNARGFDEYYGFASGHWGNYFSPQLERNGEQVRGEGFVVDDFTDKAIAFMEANRDRPFFAYLPYNTPHSPMQVPDRFWEKFEDAELEMRHREPENEDVQHTRAALAMMENVDWNVGRLMTALDDMGLTGNTIFLFFSDNGPNGSRWNDGMKGRKGSTDEGGIRSPLFVRWPAGIQPGTEVSQIAAATDLLPTLTDLAGISFTPDKPLDGVSLKPLLLGEDIAWPDRIIHTHWRGRYSLRNQQFRLDNDGALFDMVNDPGQTLDVADQHPEVYAQLTSEMQAWKTMTEEELATEDTRPFTVGYPGYTITQLPARDAEASGSIERSNRYPNDSYFLNWTNPEDRITWNVEIVEGGDFEAEIFYAVPEVDAGATIALRYGDSSIEQTITEAHDPPLLGAEQDRVLRQESYVKDFKPVSLGTISLSTGTGILSLEALEMPGSQVQVFCLWRPWKCRAARCWSSGC